ncbi:MAG: hypothetical protein FWC09_09975 [Lachnospiraceae bacterium]|nr:hypothetical protein [Lachnospiraceae bacterium]
MEKKRRLLAPIIMLSAGAAAGITMFLMRYELQRMLSILLFVLILFYILGGILNIMLTRFEAHNEAIRALKEAEEGEVIEKEMDEDDVPLEGYHSDEAAYAGHEHGHNH